MVTSFHVEKPQGRTEDVNSSSWSSSWYFWLPSSVTLKPFRYLSLSFGKQIWENLYISWFCLWKCYVQISHKRKKKKWGIPHWQTYVKINFGKQNIIYNFILNETWIKSYRDLLGVGITCFRHLVSQIHGRVHEALEGLVNKLKNLWKKSINKWD